MGIAQREQLASKEPVQKSRGATTPESSIPGGERRSPEPRIPQDRYAAVSTVLICVRFLNLAVALAKITFGYASGATSILSDGFHSLTDAASNDVRN